MAWFMLWEMDEQNEQHEVECQVIIILRRVTLLSIIQVFQVMLLMILFQPVIVSLLVERVNIILYEKIFVDQIMNLP